MWYLVLTWTGPIFDSGNISQQKNLTILPLLPCLNASLQLPKWAVSHKSIMKTSHKRQADTKIHRKPICKGCWETGRRNYSVLLFSRGAFSPAAAWRQEHSERRKSPRELTPFHARAKPHLCGSEPSVRNVSRMRSVRRNTELWDGFNTSSTTPTLVLKCRKTLVVRRISLGEHTRQEHVSL